MGCLCVWLKPCEREVVLVQEEVSMCMGWPLDMERDGETSN